MRIQNSHQSLPAGGAISSDPVHGTVRSWDDESGWGVLTSPEVPGEVWAHFSAVQTTDPGAFASLEPGEAVLFTWEEADQDGYSYRALQVRRPGAPQTVREGAEDEGDGGEDSYIRIELDPG
ncbi:cold-shock protein [Streptomyces prunicolor]|uniref:cold-shock protein n=1 Tax=Streptomyces prunicolor TaxID=67348 RepID=UPI00341ED754